MLLISKEPIDMIDFIEISINDIIITDKIKLEYLTNDSDLTELFLRSITKQMKNNIKKSDWFNSHDLESFQQLSSSQIVLDIDRQSTIEFLITMGLKSMGQSASKDIEYLMVNVLYNVYCVLVIEMMGYSIVGEVKSLADMKRLLQKHAIGNLTDELESMMCNNYSFACSCLGLANSWDHFIRLCCLYSL